MPASPRILIVRLSAIGDVMHTLPVACALKDHLPGCRVAWLVQPPSDTLLVGHRAIDELIPFERDWLKSLSRMRGLRRMLRSKRFDVAIDVQGLSKSAVPAWLSRADRRIGFARPAGRELSPWLCNTTVTPTRPHVVDQNLELLAPLGIRAPKAVFDMPVYPASAAAMEAYLSEHEFGGRFAVCNPGAGWGSKLWAAGRFARVGRHLKDAHGITTVTVWSGDTERAFAEDIVGQSGGAALLAPATSLTELAELARRACLFVSSDTGPLHIAAAVGTPCVGLFGPMPAERNGPYGPQHIAIQRQLVRGSSRKRRNADNSAMLAITAEMVCQACDQVLSRTPTMEVGRTATPFPAP